MIGKLKWEDVYLLWNNESYNFPKSSPIHDCKRYHWNTMGDSYIYSLTGTK